MPHDGEFTACYIGVSFYREVGGQQLFTSAAQMFDEKRGRGFILKGKRAHTESRGRHPYMTQADARQLISDALTAYKNHHKNYKRVSLSSRHRNSGKKKRMAFLRLWKRPEPSFVTLFGFRNRTL